MNNNNMLANMKVLPLLLWTFQPQFLSPTIPFLVIATIQLENESHGSLSPLLPTNGRDHNDDPLYVKDNVRHFYMRYILFPSICHMYFVHLISQRLMEQFVRKHGQERVVLKEKDKVKSPNNPLCSSPLGIS